LMPFAHERPHLLTQYPRLASDAAFEYLSVNGLSKKEKQKKILSMFKSLPKRRLLGDAWGAFRALR
jgi:electron transfer flavoprotein-quinone oxidoreductase